MEISAALDAARSLPGPLEVVSDSTYVVNCFRDGWWEGWLARGWVGASKQKVANRDLWEPLVELYRTAPGRLRFRWVKGHSTDPFNDLVDRLAVAAATAQQGGEGLQPPPDASLGRADVPGARPVRSGPSGGRARSWDKEADEPAYRPEGRPGDGPGDGPGNRREDRPGDRLDAGPGDGVAGPPNGGAMLPDLEPGAAGGARATEGLRRLDSGRAALRSDAVKPETTTRTTLRGPLGAGAPTSRPRDGARTVVFSWG